jgi:glutamate racemase
MCANCSAMGDTLVAVFDSGIGGLPYVTTARALDSAVRFVYVADHANFPYGTRSPDDLRSRIISLVQRIIEKEEPRAILVACNTASVVALAALRERFDIPFVGVVPAVKPAASQSRNRRIGVLATTRTVQERYLAFLVEQFAGQCTVTTVAAGEIVDLVEKSYGSPDRDAVERVVLPAVHRLLAAEVDTVVLGCTHFIFLIDQLQQLFGPSVSVIDSRQGVARRLLQVIFENRSDRERPTTPQHPHRFYTTGALTTQLETLSRKYGFDEAAEL